MHVLFADILPDALKPYPTMIFGAIGAGVFFIVLLIALKTLLKKKPLDPDAGLDERLAEYPPPPKAGTHRLQFEGQPVRIRLIVLAPAGRTATLTAEMAEGLLETIMPGLGSVAQLDKPRVRIWPPQLSVKGFAPTFHRHVHVPEPKAKPSRFILVAGAAKAGAKSVLLGMALECGQPNMRGAVRLDGPKWHDAFRVQIVG